MGQTVSVQVKYRDAHKTCCRKFEMMPRDCRDRILGFFLGSPFHQRPVLIASAVTCPLNRRGSRFLRCSANAHATLVHRNLRYHSVGTILIFYKFKELSGFCSTILGEFLYSDICSVSWRSTFQIQG